MSTTPRFLGRYGTEGERRVDLAERSKDESIAGLWELYVSQNSVTRNPLLIQDGGRTLLGGVACGLCGHVSFPIRPVCPNCLGTKVEEMPIGAHATLLMHTVSYVVPEGFEAPLVQAWVRLDEGPEIFSLLFCSTEDAARLSAGQRLEFEVDIDGTKVEKWGYRPVR